MTRVWMEQGTGLPWSKSGGPSPARYFPGIGHPFLDVTDRPSLTLRAHVLNIVVEEGPDVAAPTAARVKPAYRVPTMEEIRAQEPNGFTAVSTFSGCGGSSTGYRMAGFRVAWASEFVPAAQDSYRANMAPGTVLDGRDVRDVKPKEILDVAGEVDLFDGSPPCASFSTAGVRERGWGREKVYSDTVQRSDDLFFEYARLIEGVQPKTFVAENVSGLVKGTAKGYFKLILRRLRAAGYRVEARLLNAAQLGVPQARQRLIFIGVREDLGLDPVFPRPLPYTYTVRDALPHVLRQARPGAFGDGDWVEPDAPSMTLGASPSSGNGLFPPSGVIASRVVHDTSGQFGSGDVTDRPCPTITVGEGSANSHHYQVHYPGPIGDPPRDPETGADLLIRTVRKRPSSGLAARGQARKLTLPELRALSSFPPDFELTGNYAQRWERIGRAVPPVMMRHVAETVRDQILRKVQQ